MAATKLNPAAPPFHALHLAPPPPPPFPLAGATACRPQFPFVTYFCVAAPPSSAHIGFCFPVQHPPASHPSSPAFRKGGVVPAAAVHGRPPHKLMKRQAAAAMKPWKQQQQQPPAPPTAAVASAAMVPAGSPRKPRLARRKAERSMARPVAKPMPMPKPARAKVPRPRKAAGPRARRAAAPAAQLRGSSPAPEQTMYTTGRNPGPPLPEPKFNNTATTVMLRNIPNKLRSSDMISLLDDHCRRMNRGGGVVSAYDALYLPMDFRRGYNFGYSFINFTTPDAARRLYYDLEECGWNVHGSKKTINIVQAKIQGTVALGRHFRQKKLECDDEEFLPAIFSPPRDGFTAGSIARIAWRPTTTKKTAMGSPAPAPAPSTPPKASC
ncbi:hypothetical protein HU200_003579 [Digitaria exilis]|uniref:RRM domain-containing protein n=1 Tax=Digitaria exilis TaxID=1010633 RepID=A0A835KY66_9POAL|nr:hypothetical protein HU200_003579 [Digitaria exilis]